MSKYVISSSPHLRDNVSTTSIMRDVCIALLPAAVQQRHRDGMP